MKSQKSFRTNKTIDTERSQCAVRRLSVKCQSPFFGFFADLLTFAETKYLPRMKQAILFLSLCLVSLSLQAQQPTSTAQDSLRLTTTGEAIVRGVRVVREVDRSILYPTATQKAHSPELFSLLAQLPLPGLRIDPVNQSISSAANLGRVVLKINDVPATAADLQALDVGLIRRVEYVDVPGIREGEDVFAMVNVIVHRPTSGIDLAFNLRQPLTIRQNDTDLHLGRNRGRSAWNFDYGIHSSHLTGQSFEDRTQYLFQDGTTILKQEHSLGNLNDNLSHNFQLRYSNNLPGRYYLQATLSGSLSKGHHDQTSAISLPDADYEERSWGRSKGYAPTLDLYGRFQLSPRQSLFFDLNLALAETDADAWTRSPYFSNDYMVDGRTRALSSQLQYEARLKPFVLTVGLEYNQQYLRNLYDGSTIADSRMNQSFQRGYVGLAGRLSGLNYSLGLGASRNYSSQATDRIEEWYFRPQLTLSYPLSRELSLHYSLFSQPFNSRFMNQSDLTIQKDRWSVLSGNPHLRPARRTEQTLYLTLTRPRYVGQLTAYYRAIQHPVMSKVERRDDGIFVFSKANQKAIHMYYFNTYHQVTLIPQKLNLMVDLGYYRFINLGDDYSHRYGTFNGSASLTATLGRFTLYGAWNSGWRWLEGESKGFNRPETYLSASYRPPLRRGGNLSVGLTLGNPFQPHYRSHDTTTLNRYVRQQIQMRNGDLGNLVLLKINYRFSHGRKQTEQQRLKSKAIDTGVIR